MPVVPEKLGTSWLYNARRPRVDLGDISDASVSSRNDPRLDGGSSSLELSSSSLTSLFDLFDGKSMRGVRIKVDPCWATMATASNCFLYYVYNCRISVVQLSFSGFIFE